MKKPELDRRSFLIGGLGLGVTALLGRGLAGCSGTEDDSSQGSATDTAQIVAGLENAVVASRERELAEGLSCVRFDGNDRLDAFFYQGGARSDLEVVSFLTDELMGPLDDAISFLGGAFGCSVISAHTPEGEPVFGRNFDWQRCSTCIVMARPESAYASISTVNMDFLNQYGGVLEKLPTEARTLVLTYAPLDGMNECGLAVAVLMIQDGSDIAQSTGRTGLTTTAAVRALLNRASNVEEALSLLESCDMHASMGLMVHFALSDATGRSVVVEYVENQMVIIESPVVTNFYLAEGSKHGVGSAQSHERYERLIDRLGDSESLSMNDVRDALDSVSKHNYNDGQTTEWSMVCNQKTGEVRYYHREDFSRGFVFDLSQL